MKRHVLLFMMILAVALTPVALAKPKAVKAISLSSRTLTLKAGVSEDLTVTFKPSDATSAIKWKSSNGGVAVVDEDGVVTAVAAGTATITATTKNGKVARCIVTVPDPEKVIAFTFDDGPCANTQKILDILNENCVKATFFMLGENVDNNPSIAKAVSDAGNEIGSHSVNHKSLQKISLDDAKWQVSNSLASIEKATGKRPTLIRAPYGAIDASLAAKLNKDDPITFVQWSIDPEDWKDRDAKTVYQRVMDNVKPGRIVLMHDLYGTTTDAVKMLIPALKKQGYTFVTVSELIEQRGLTDTSGTIIF